MRFHCILETKLPPQDPCLIEYRIRFSAFTKKTELRSETNGAPKEGCEKVLAIPAVCKSTGGRV